MNVWQSARIHLADVAKILETSCCLFLDYVFMNVCVVLMSVFSL